SIFFFIAIVSYPAFWRPVRARLRETLEVETRFAGCVGEGFYAAMVKIATTIEDHLLDALLFGALGDQLANLGGGGDVATVVLLFTFFAHGGGRGDGDSAVVVDELGVDVV